MARRSRPVRTAAAALALAVVAGCGVRADSSPRAIDDPEGAFQVPPRGADAAGADRIYLVGSDNLLRSVRREATTVQDLIEVLLQGPNDSSQERQLSTAIPSATALNRVRSSGSTLLLDFSSDLADVAPAQQQLAVAQIVFTASALEGVREVEITIDDVAQPFLKGNGESTVGRLQVYDYPGFAQTAQPPYPALPNS